MSKPAIEAAVRAWDGDPKQLANDLIWAAEEALEPLRKKHSEWTAALRTGDDVASVVALAVLEDLAPLMFPPICRHDWRTYEDEATKTEGDQEWTCALCGEVKVVNPPAKAVHEDDDEPRTPLTVVRWKVTRRTCGICKRGFAAQHCDNSTICSPCLSEALAPATSPPDSRFT